MNVPRLFAHQDDPDIDDPLPEGGGTAGHKLGESGGTEGEQSEQEASAAQPKSLKCDE